MVYLEKLAGVSSVAKWTGVSLPETAVESPGWWWGTPLIETPEATPILNRQPKLPFIT